MKTIKNFFIALGVGIKTFLHEILAPTTHYTYYNNSEKVEIKPEDWEAIRKDFEKVGEDMDNAFKNAEKIFNKRT